MGDTCPGSKQPDTGALNAIISLRATCPVTPHLPRVEPAGGLVGVAAEVALVVRAGRGRRVERVRERQRRAGVGPRAVAHDGRLDEALRPRDAHLAVARAPQRLSGSDCSRRCQYWVQLVARAAALPRSQGPSLAGMCPLLRYTYIQKNKECTGRRA